MLVYNYFLHRHSSMGTHGVEDTAPFYSTFQWTTFGPRALQADVFLSQCSQGSAKRNYTVTEVPH